MSSRTITADRGDAGQRLDLVLRRHLRDIPRATRTRVQAWIADGQVQVNGTSIRRPAARAAFGDVVAVALSGVRARAVMEPEDAALTVLYEDDQLIAVDKPAGVVVHPTYKRMTGTIMNALLWRAQQWPQGQRPSIVGRLDLLTSGIVLAAKSAAAHAALQRTMASSDSEKNYLAIVFGRVNVARGQIDARLGVDGDRRRVVVLPTGAESLTRFERLARGSGACAELSTLRCRLVTGRRHQIRVHLASRGWPIVGDPLYGEPRWQAIADAALAERLRLFPRQALHAWTLRFCHPLTRQFVNIEAPIPADMRELMTQCHLS